MIALALTLLLVVMCVSAGAVEVTVEVEEDVYEFGNADNGSGPLWCAGSTCLVEAGGRLFASGFEVITDAKPLNNVRWTLFTREDDGWRLLKRDEAHRTREPSPMAAFHDGSVFLSVNPTLTEPDTYNGPARPEILQIDPAEPDGEWQTLLPGWSGEPPFTEHSYRSFAADGANGELLLLQDVGYTHSEWALLDREGEWSAQGQLKWPWGADYPTPQPIRTCYPNVALRDGAAYFCGVSDIVEPYPEWRAYKKDLTGRDWDYDFRRLFYTWSPDITKGEFTEWIEVASRDKTAGWIFPCDMRIDEDGRAHIMWNERAIDERLRERSFPEEKQKHQLNYAIVEEGKVVSRRTLLEGGEGLGGEVPGRARFHVTPEGRMYVFCWVGGTDPDGNALGENRVFEMNPDGSNGTPVRVPMADPLTSFFTNTPRAGSPPSEVLHLYGDGAKSGNVMRYARVRITE